MRMEDDLAIISMENSPLALQKEVVLSQDLATR
jgi:hypothetical protein